MTMPRVLRAALGIFAILATATMLVLDIANAQTARKSSQTVQIAAVVASACEAIAMLVLMVLLYMCLRPSTLYSSKKSNSIWFAVSLLGSVVATTASVVVLVDLGQETEEVDILGAPELNFLVASAVVLGLTFAGQLILVVAYFVASRLHGAGQAFSLHTEDGHRSSPSMHIESIPYTRTIGIAGRTKERLLAEFQSPPGSSSGRPVAETLSSIHTSLSHVVRPITSKTRLLSTSSRTRRRTGSLDSNANREPTSITEEGFDSWDTSGVDAHNRQTVLETSSPSPRRFLETIPASPTTSRSPSPGFPLDLDTSRRIKRRSRSFSPFSRPPPALTTRAPTSELHIHPLFRSDSPTPPPGASPDTMVVAAPDAGKVISQRNLTRMRSGSLPLPCSHLSRQGSYDSFRRKADSSNNDSFSPTPIEPIEERKMTPPIPEWILTAGSRTSLTEYQIRKLRDREDIEEAGLGITE